MRLCGISSRFQLLSPGIRQVIHALLTRPPLTFISLGFNKSPFDLHVLSTPPAFILSQDQTLMFKSFILAPVKLANHFSWFLSVAIYIAVIKDLFSEYSSKEFLLNSFLIRIFRVALLFICQCSACFLCCCFIRHSSNRLS